eukprot:4566624-Alexandrium_andersonii.AAC.1
MDHPAAHERTPALLHRARCGHSAVCVRVHLRATPGARSHCARTFSPHGNTGVRPLLLADGGVCSPAPA